MVEFTQRLDNIFGSLADATRRDILKRVAREELSVTELAEPYHVSLAAVSKHLMILQKAKLIRKRRQGKQQFVQISPGAFKDAQAHLRAYKKLWKGTAVVEKDGGST